MRYIFHNSENRHMLLKVSSTIGLIDVIITMYGSMPTSPKSFKGFIGSEKNSGKTESPERWNVVSSTKATGETSVSSRKWSDWNLHWNWTSMCFSHCFCCKLQRPGLVGALSHPTAVYSRYHESQARCVETSRKTAAGLARDAGVPTATLSKN